MASRVFRTNLAIDASSHEQTHAERPRTEGMPNAWLGGTLRLFGVCVCFPGAALLSMCHNLSRWWLSETRMYIAVFFQTFCNGDRVVVVSIRRIMSEFSGP